MYWQNPNYYYPGYYFQRYPVGFEPPTVQQFKRSAHSFVVPAQELQTFLHAINLREGYAKHIMDAAQANKKEEVKQLIQSAGVHTPFTVDYNPDGIIIIFQPSDVKSCFTLRMSLCW